MFVKEGPASLPEVTDLDVLGNLHGDLLTGKVIVQEACASEQLIS